MPPKSWFALALVAVPSYVWAAGSLCEMEGWQCAAVSATVGHTTVNAIHDATHQDSESLDGGVADISVPVGKMLTIAWQGEPDKDVKSKPRAHATVVPNKPAQAGCEDPKFIDETLSGSSDVNFNACQEGRDFVVTYRIDQGKGKGEAKVTHLRIHVLPKGASVDDGAVSNSLAATRSTPELPPDEQADFDKLQVY